MEEEACTNFKSIRAKFQEEIQVRYRPALPEKPKRLPTSAVGRSGLITMSFSSAVEAKTASQPRVILREDLKTPSGKRPVSFPSTTSGDGPNRQSLKMWHSPLVLPLSSEPKHDSSAPPSKSITSPLKFIMKPIPTPFSLTRVSVCGREIGKNGLGLVKNSGAFNVQMEESTVKTASTEAVEVQQTMVSNPGLLDHPPSPNDSLRDSSSGSVTHFFDQHVLSTLEKAKRKLCHKNLLVCGRPKGFYSSKAQAQLAESPGSCHQETSPLKINATSKTAITVMEHGGVMQSEKACKPLPDLATLGPSPSKPPRPPHVDLSKYKTGSHTSDPSEALTVESAPEAEIVATANASLEDASVPPPEFPDFDISAPEATDSNGINLAALDLEATEFPGFDSLPPPPPLPDEDDGLHLQAVLVQHCPSHFGPKQSEDALCQSLEDAGILTSATEPVTFDLRINGSHASFNLSAEHQLPSEPMQNSSQQKRFHETFDNVYEDVETVPRFSFAQSSYKCKGAPKNPYADNGHVKEETWRNIWHVTQWSNAAEDQNGQHDRKKLSPEHHEDKEQKKKEKQRLEKEKKEQKEKDKKRNEMHKRFKITGLEEPMYHARVLADSKLRKYDLPVKSGDLISIIRTVSCPKGKWLARDANNKYGYISVMNVELNIKEMLELGKKVSQAAGRGQTNGDDLSVSSRSSHQNPVFTSSFTDDSEEWMYEDDTLSLSAENLSLIKATSMPEMFDSNSSAHHPSSDWSIEDMQTQEAESFQFADIDLLPPPALYADSL
ncbi:FYN-binding protein-like isoform X1 [Sinocyclocheilus anshuiensis]|uniref:FYN-binding protein-like n=1 Tax=Sinocyclocheilus anshuiensis TaxID=1608454 RepID=A0A671LZJ1_9TELE|nr:PREDICTED: FYN-binding protein-like isoform X1 [Sinocyclocheilus anshuiensis]